VLLLLVAVVFCLLLSDLGLSIFDLGSGFIWLRVAFRRIFWWLCNLDLLVWWLLEWLWSLFIDARMLGGFIRELTGGLRGLSGGLRGLFVGVRVLYT